VICCNLKFNVNGYCGVFKLWRCENACKGKEVQTCLQANVRLTYDILVYTELYEADYLLVCVRERINNYEN
jgi:hypothetical protein